MPGTRLSARSGRKARTERMADILPIEGNGASCVTRTRAALATDHPRMLAECMEGERVVLFVCDAEDAYWQIPLAPEEQEIHCCILRMPDGKIRYLVYLVTAQGSRGAPLSWAVIFGLIGRCVLAVLRDPALGFASGGRAVRLQVTVA